MVSAALPSCSRLERQLEAIAQPPATAALQQLLHHLLQQLPALRPHAMTSHLTVKAAVRSFTAWASAMQLTCLPQQRQLEATVLPPVAAALLAPP